MFPRYRQEAFRELREAALMGTRGDADALRRWKSRERLVIPEPGLATAGDGAKAFRSATDSFVDMNGALAAQRAAERGITPREAKEVVFFGMMQLRTVEWDAVEGLLGREIDNDTRVWATDLMKMSNREAASTLARLVQEGVPEDERMQAFEAVENTYLATYRERLGMTDDQFDELLARSPFEPDSIAPVIESGMNAPGPADPGARSRGR